MRDIRRLGTAVNYRDGSEQRVLDILDRAGDLSSGSDELAAHVHDWPTRYHFSPQRANLLSPIRFAPGMRVLDVGAGMGALARHVAETGAEVVALDGSLERCEAAARRCRDLDNVEVVHGPLTAFEDGAGFDVVLCVGVLEYTAPASREALVHLRGLTRPGGVLALAIENQLGLRYLLGYGEDHLLEPWAGVEGYPGTTHVRTFSRARLRRMLGDAGFPDQHWLFPFPDYKLPTVVLAEGSYGAPDGARFVDQLVRWPCSAEASPAARLCDDRLAHRVFLDAGIGPEVANSFLVLAGDGPTGMAELLDRGVTAWFCGAERLRLWRASKTFVRGEGGAAEVTSAPATDAPGSAGWLRQCRPAAHPLLSGPTLEQRFLEACSQGRDEAEAVLRGWRDHLGQSETVAECEPPSEESHPFRHAGSRTLLPPDHIDVNLSNFIDSGDGLVYIDREWIASGPVGTELVVLRALWGLAADLVLRGVLHPWSSSSTVDELSLALCRVCAVSAGPSELEIWRLAEADLLMKVKGGSAEEHLDWLYRSGAMSSASGQVRRALPYRTLRRELAVVQHRLGIVEGRLVASEADEERLDRELAAARADLAASAEALEAARLEATALAAQLQVERPARAEAEHA